MRAQHLLVGGLALLLAACSGGKPAQPPAPLNKQLLSGKWKNSSEIQFISGYEFADDGTAKVTLLGLAQPVPARYAWTGERTIELQYQTVEVQQAYQAAAKAYKEDLAERVKAKKLYDRAGTTLSAAVRDDLPAKETLQVALSEKPPLLILTSEGKNSQTFERAD